MENFCGCVFGDYSVSLSGLHISLSFIFFCIVVIAILQTKIPFVLSFTSSLYKFCLKSIKEYAGQEFSPFISQFLFSLFVALSINNICGALFLPSAIMDIKFLIFLVSIVFVFSIIEGMVKKGPSFLLTFWDHKVPLLIRPIYSIVEFIGFLIKPVSIAARLFINVIIGHLIISILNEIAFLLGAYQWILLPIFIFTTLLECFIGLLQAYLFLCFSSMLIGFLAKDH